MFFSPASAHGCYMHPAERKEIHGDKELVVVETLYQDTATPGRAQN